MLNGVFKAFDMDGGGTLDISELYGLGKARRRTGAKVSAWTEGKTEQMMSKMERDEDGRINRRGFVGYMMRKLMGEDDEDFEEAMDDFMEVTLILTLTLNLTLEPNPNE